MRQKVSTVLEHRLDSGLSQSSLCDPSVSTSRLGEKEEGKKTTLKTEDRSYLLQAACLPFMGGT